MLNSNLTAQQKADRQGYIGSSHAAAIMEMDPYASPYDAWAEITGRVDPKKASKAADLGLILEPAVIDWLEQKMGMKILRQVDVFPGHIMHRGPDYCGAHLDGMIEDAIVEAKTSGLTSILSKDWGEDGSDEIPMRIIFQVHHQMICTGFERALVPALVPPLGMRLYEIRLNDAILTSMLNRYKVFWEKFVLGDTPPDNSLPSVDTIKRWRREPGKTVDVPSSLAYAYLDAKAYSKQAETDKDLAWSRLAAAIGDAECAVWDGGMLTYRADKNGVRRLNIREN